MTEKTFTIPNISCGHCVAAVKKELVDLDGVREVDGDPATKSISVKFDAPATEKAIKEILKEINYPAE